MDDFGGLGETSKTHHNPRRRRDTWLYVATIVTLLLQVVVAAYPEVCTLSALTKSVRDTVKQ